MNREESKQLARELEGHKPTLVICGGGHVGYYVEQLGRLLDFEVIIVDDREEFANSERYPYSRVLCAPFVEAVEHIKNPEECYFVTLTRGHSHDLKCLEVILQKGFKYVGMMGSKAKVQIVMEKMSALGFSKDLLEKIHTPIGVEIGAATPAEIGVSIVAELIKVRSEESIVPYVGSDVIQAIESEEAMVIATIISKSGSAPRGIGSAIVLKKDGTTVGTVGGGSVEHVVIQRAKEIVGTDTEEVVRFNMATQGENRVGMVCGGEVEILFQSIV